MSRQEVTTDYNSTDEKVRVIFLAGLLQLAPKAVIDVLATLPKDRHAASIHHEVITAADALEAVLRHNTVVEISRVQGGVQISRDDAKLVIKNVPEDLIKQFFKW
ncbi:MAG TPA: hypothetical protein VJ246_03695 [Patescibacteria group bacterium]|nr:hypothetical protein [Patescibacteria group bacterium]